MRRKKFVTNYKINSKYSYNHATVKSLNGYTYSDNENTDIITDSTGEKIILH